MRTSPVIGTKVWFGPRRFGWGLDPVSAEGWIVTVVAVASTIVVRRWQPPRRFRAERLLAAGLVLVAVLKGTSPGGPRARRAFLAARATTPETSS